jgi:hypothetical protein
MFDAKVLKSSTKCNGSFPRSGNFREINSFIVLYS